MNKWIYFIIISLSATTFNACKEEKKVEEVFIRPVKYQEVGFNKEGKYRSFSGTTQTDKVISLSFRNSGIITDFNIKLGQKVKKGQLLAKLDNVQARLSYEQSITQLNSAESQMNTSKLSLNRVRALYEKGSSSLSDFESAKNAYKTAQESYESAKRGVDIQKEQVRYGYLYAPETGVIADVIAEVDENVSPGQTIAILNAGKEMEITLGIPESVINGIQLEKNVKINFSAIPNRQFEGEVSEVAPTVDPNNLTYPVRVKVLKAVEEIKSGMTATVIFDFNEVTSDKKALVVPAKAVGEDSQGRYVFLVVEKGNEAIVKKQRITIGKLSGEGFEIKSGLSAGQKIAIAGLQTLLDGQQVRLR